MFGNQKTHRVSLDRDNLQRLMQGEIVRIGKVEIALQDIGYQQMHMAVIHAQEELLKREKHERSA